jgi:hypothetical protein
MSSLRTFRSRRAQISSYMRLQQVQLEQQPYRECDDVAPDDTRLPSGKQELGKIRLPSNVGCHAVADERNATQLQHISLASSSPIQASGSPTHARESGDGANLLQLLPEKRSSERRCSSRRAVRRLDRRRSDEAHLRYLPPNAPRMEPTTGLTRDFLHGSQCVAHMNTGRGEPCGPPGPVGVVNTWISTPGADVLSSSVA